MINTQYDIKNADIDVIKYFSCYGNGISKEDICFLAQFAFKTKLIPFMK